MVLYAPESCWTVSNDPGNPSVSLFCASLSSSAEMDFPSAILRYSLANSDKDSFVLSVCTGERVRYGRWPRADGSVLNTPYDQCLSSRRFILMRELKDPP